MIAAFVTLLVIAHVNNSSKMPKPMRTNKLLYASVMVMLPMLLKYNTIQGKIDAETTDRIATTVPLFFCFLFIIN